MERKKLSNFFWVLPIMALSMDISKPLTLTFLDDFNMNSGPVWGPMTPGQLSGLAFDPTTKNYFAISDDRYDRDQPDWSRGHTRFYKISLPITIEGKGPSSKWTISLSKKFRLTYLKDMDGKNMPFEKLDAEGITLLPNGNLAIASEGNAQIGGKANGAELPPFNPALYEFTPRGKMVQSYPIPEYYHSVFEGRTATRGVVNNNGFESLARFENYLYTATEAPLVQDGGAVTFERGGFTRILKLARSGNSYQPAQEFAYPVDRVPLPTSWGAPGVAKGGENGVVELIALDENNLLVLERAFIKEPYFRNHIRLYRVNLNGATNTLGQEKLDTNHLQAVKKELLLDFEEILNRLEPNKLKGTERGALENYEGMVLVKLPDGSQGIVFISDNNHKVAHQRQSLLLFRVDGI